MYVLLSECWLMILNVDLVWVIFVWCCEMVMLLKKMLVLGCWLIVVMLVLRR